MMRKNSLFTLFCAVLALCLCACEKETPAAEGELEDGGLCSVSLGISQLPDFEEVTTRSVSNERRAQGITWETLDSSTGEARVEGSDETLPLFSSIRREYDSKAVKASTRAFDNSKLFGANSKFRMLVFKGEYGKNSVDMDTPAFNYTCQVNSAGNGASFLSPVTALFLPKGDYVFVCFPEKYNPWAVGQSASGTNCHVITLPQDEDFLCLKTGTVSINTAAYQLNLSTFTRYGYLLTVNFELDSSTGYLTNPTGQIPLTISDDGSTYRLINTSARFNLRDKSISGFSGHSITGNVKVNGSGSGQTYTGFTYYLLSNPSANNHMTIGYPSLSVQTTDGVKTIAAGTLKVKAATALSAGYSYFVTLAIQENILVTFRNAAGDEKEVTFAKGNIYYNKSNKIWGIGPEQCDYGYVENNVTPGTNDINLVDGNISYYFMYGMAESCGRATTGYYTGMDDVPVDRDPCAKLPGGKWKTPSRDVFWMMGFQGVNNYNGNYNPKDTNDYYAVDENGNRLVSSGNPNPYFSSYTPTDGRSNKSAIPGIWIGLSQSAASTASSTSKYNKSKLFLPAAGSRNHEANNFMSYDVGKYGYYWSSQPYAGPFGQNFYFSGSEYNLASNDRNYGFPVRCVLP